MANKPRTLFDKIWDSHLIEMQPDGTGLLYIDRHLVHEVTSPQAFEGLRAAHRKVHRPDATITVPDHNVPTSNRAGGITDEESRIQVELLERNAKEFGITYFGMSDIRQGIVHIIGPEQGLTQPGMTIVCGDSHTATHGAVGALAFGIGTSEVEHVLATQTLIQRRPKNMLVEVNGTLGLGVTPKDVILAIIGKIGIAGGTGHVIEYAGDVFRRMSMEGRMTVCNMSIEGGAWEQALAFWKTLPSDPGAHYDTTVSLDAATITPQVTWGTKPEHVLPITGAIPNPDDDPDEERRNGMKRALEYMALKPGTRMTDIAIDHVFIGSC